MKKIILLTMLLLLASCASWQEMGETGEPPVGLSNRYSAAVKIVTRASLVREPWNYAAGLLSAVTNGGIDLRVDKPVEE